ncbi:MAG: sulfatase [Victivallales bacterium]|nr:sulfatase [Victivallales bacterium]
MKKSNKIIFWVLGLIFYSVNIHASTNDKKPNILFIAIDDLRPELGCYGKDYIHSPNIDKLASSGYLFNQAYCQVPVCGASRASILTGMLPTQNRFLSYHSRMDEDAPGFTTLPMHFKNNGYYTVNIGKVSHFPDDQDHSWSEPPKRPDWEKLPDGSWSTEGWHDYLTEKNVAITKTDTRGFGPPYEKANVPDSAYSDGKSIEMAKRKLRELKELEQPFFFALGMLKPHLPFNAPSKYWDLYDEERIKMAPNPYLPVNVPQEGINNFGELRSYTGVPKQGPVSDSMAHNLVHGYYACVSYTDALIGDFLNELDKLGLTENTIIILWSDHGFFLGEHGFWCKHALYELATRVPMIVKLPGVKSHHEINTIVELVDIYPTLCELTVIPLPEHLQGKSFIKAFENPDYQHRSFAYSRFESGESIKKNGKRYSQYFTNDGVLNSEMLYDHEKDPAENVNVVDQILYRAEVGKYSSIIDSIRNNHQHE